MWCVYNLSVALQYMVVYQCIVAGAETAAYITDGSHLTNSQVSTTGVAPFVSVQLYAGVIVHDQCQKVQNPYSTTPV